MKEELVVVIPAKNESATIGKVIERTRENLQAYFDDIAFIVSSSSSDGTEEVARKKGADVIKDGGTGLGEAMQRGVKQAARKKPDYILTLDSDLQFRPEEATELIENRDSADLVLGSRFLEDGVQYDMSFTHRTGNKMLNKTIQYFLGAQITDAQTGYRLMTRQVAEELRMIGRHTYVQEMIIDSVQNGFEVQEVPVSFDPRQSGRSKVVSSETKYALRTLPILVHRLGLTPYLTTGISLALGTISVLKIFSTVLPQPSHNIGTWLVLLAVSTILFYMGMVLDADYP